MIALTENGDFKVNEAGRLTQVTMSPSPEEQRFQSECRCLQGDYFADRSYGLDPLIWYLPSKPADKVSDLVRVSAKYLTARSISYDDQRETYNIIC